MHKIVTIIRICVVFILLQSIWSCDKSVPDTRCGWDEPENEGVYNTLKNADQIVNVKYSIPKGVNAVYGVYPANSSITGLLYSSTRSEDLFCPNNVSWWTFMSALNNPNSYIYTVDISLPPHSIRGLAKPYYGQVCTSFIQYALGIKYNFQIHQMTIWDGFDKLIHQKVDSLKLGDVLTTESGHTRLVTGIYRDQGKVENVIISEGVPPVAKKVEYTADEIAATLKEENYYIYRYKYISQTPKANNPFSSVFERVRLNEYLCPRRGDKANWRKDEVVVVDILKLGDYDKYSLYKDGVMVDTQSVAKEQSEIVLGVLPYGHYEMFLSNEYEQSSSVYWIVADYDIYAEAKGDGKVWVGYSSKNARPIWITWRRPAFLDADNNNMPLWTEVITPQDAATGARMTELDEYTKRRCGLGEWDFKVAFETDYGIITSDSVSLYVE